ncbi:afls pathway regulator [Grosmannia clavigera kw1407]|uniref:Afls pathway regulator n=1 Tax=Grosmannia clavigera (strain kw1407 / UAMH 11150) TaxID=655863 RepID=F0XMV9_GROCL|nr:afls pathway regulator [Grosmannia clavigera kw1407]EFX00780.1 afls pathway regulator [Grosmannia clavigera kw1407]
MKRAGRKKQQQQHDSSQQPPKRQPPRKSAVESRRPLSSVSVSLPPPDGGTVIGTPENTISSRQPMPLDLFMLDPKDLTNTYPAIDGAYAFTLPLPSKERNTTRTEFPEPLDLQIGSNEEASSSGAENDNITINLPAGSAGTNTEAFTPQAGGQDPFDDSDWMFWSPTFTQDEPDAYTPHHSSSVPIGTAVDLGSIRASSDISLSDNCLSLAMGILGTLTPPLAMCPRMPNSEGKHRQDSVGTDAGASGSAINTFDDIMQRNVASIEAIRPILKCQCSMNSSVVLILSHIIFQILWWYTAAAGVPCVASWLPLGQRTQLPQVPPPISATMPGYGSVEEGTQEHLTDQVASDNSAEPHEADHFLRALVSQSQLLASIHWLNRSQVLACVPPDEAVPFQDVADMACVSVSELRRVVRFTAMSGFICEPQADFVAHTKLSRHFLLKTALSDAVLFFGDAVLCTALNTPLTTQLQTRTAHGRNPAFPYPITAFPLGGSPQPRLKRQAAAFQRQVLQQALSSERATADLLESWMADASSDNSTVVQICCESDAVARAVASRHPQLYFVIQLSMKTQPTCAGIHDNAGFGHVTIQHCVPTSAQRITDAWLYIIHLPTPSIVPAPVDMLSQATQMLWAHFDVLRQNRSSRLIIVASGLLGSTKANSKAEAAVRMYDLLLMQMTIDKHAIAMNQMEQLLGNIRDLSWRLVIRRKEISDSHPTVAFEVGLVVV